PVHRARVFSDDVNLHAATVDELRGVLVVGKEQAPDAEAVAGHRVGETVPVVEVADGAELKRPRRPLAIPDAWLSEELTPIEAEIVMALADLPEQSTRFIELTYRIAIEGLPRGELADIRL